MEPISARVPTINFREDAERRLRQTYIAPLVRSFFNARGIDGKPREITAAQAITDWDFAQTGDLSFAYLYDVVMKGVQKRDGKISHVAYSLTFDPALCPLTCEKTDVHYGHLTLAERPVLYYILLDLPTLIARLRQHSDLKPAYGER